MSFNETLMRRRKELNMTQDELAEKLDISRQSISRWENGECLPEADKLLRLPDILDISLDELVGRKIVSDAVVHETHDNSGNKSKWLPCVLTAAACVVIGVGCFFAGRYLAPYHKNDAMSVNVPDIQEFGMITYFNEDGEVAATESIAPIVFPYDDYFSPLDRAMTMAEMYEYLIENYPDLGKDKAEELAEELADRIADIEKALVNEDLDALSYCYTEM